jgi:hypothetical protein
MYVYKIATAALPLGAAACIPTLRTSLLKAILRFHTEFAPAIEAVMFQSRKARLGFSWSEFRVVEVRGGTPRI